MKKTIWLIAAVVLMATNIAVAQADTGIHQKVTGLLLKKKHDKAEKIALKAYQKKPDDAETICALACVYRALAHKSGINVNASAMGIKDGESGTYEIKDGDLKTLFQERHYYEREPYKKAEKLYYEIIKKHPEYVNAYFNLLNDYVLMEEFDNYFKVIDIFTSNLKKSEATPHQLLDLGTKLFEGKYYDQAVQLYNIVIKSFSNFTYVKTNIGAIHLKKGEMLKAVAIFKEVYSTNPEDELNTNNLITGSIFIEDFKTAYKFANILAKKHSKNYFQLYKAGSIAFILNKDYSKHYDAFLQHRKNDDDDVDDVENDFWYQSALELKNIGSKPKKEQISILESMMYDFNKAGYDSYTILFGNMINTIEPTSNSLVLTASVYDKNNFVDKTIKWLDKIKKRKRKDDQIMSTYNLNSNYGRIHYVGKHFKKAIKYFKSNEGKKENDARNNYFIGKCSLALGRTASAKKYFQINRGLNVKEQMEYINYSIRELEKLQ